MDFEERGVPYYIGPELSGTKRFFGFIFIVGILLVLSYVLVFLLAYVFEDISVTISPMQKSLYVVQGEKESITFDITLKTNPICMSSCESKLIDLNNEINLSSKKFDFYSLYPDKKQNITEHFVAPEFGIGQKLYNLEIRCKNLFTPFCMTHGQWYKKTALITLNYEFDFEKEKLKDKSKETLELMLNSLNNSDYNLQKTEYILFETKNKMVADEKINSTYQLAEISFASFKYLTDNLINEWYDEDYSAVIEKLDQSTVDQIFKLKNKSEEILLDEINLISKHNGFSDEIKQEEDKINRLNNKNFSFKEIGDFYDLYLSFSSLNFSSYDSFENQLTLGKFSLNSKFNGQISEISSEIDREAYLRCNLKGFCEEDDSEIQTNLPQEDDLNATCSKIKEDISKKTRADNFFAYNYALSNNLGIENLTLENAYSLVYENLSISNYMGNKKFEEEVSQLYTNNIIKSRNNETRNKNLEISGLNSLILKYDELRKKANILIQGGGSKEDVGLCNNLSLILNEEKDNYKREILLKYTLPICNSLVESIISGENGTNTKQIEEITNLSYYEEEITLESPQSFDISLEIMAINLSSKENAKLSEFFKIFCKNQTNADKKIIFNLTKIVLPSFSSFNPRINTNIKEPVKMCCVFGKCNPCCVNYSCYNDTKTYPVILLHGHEFNRANSPEYTLESMNSIEGYLEKNGYVNAGIVLPTSSYGDVQQGEWGISGMPVVIKTTYYYSLYGENASLFGELRSNEHIETYSDRLNYIIELVKYRAGKDRVNIIAHSMGGLVARKYIEKYGEDSIYNLIMVGTPNFGIVGDVDEYCPLFGEEIECNEMKQNSTFLDSLNKYIPKNKTRFYNVVGRGCSINNLDSDGIVPAKNVPLSYSTNYFVNGTCPNVFTLLHSKMLDTVAYPFVSESIKNILKSSNQGE